MNNFEHLLSLSPAELADLFAKASCVYPDFDNCLVMDCPACVLGWLNEKHNGSGLTEYEKIHSMSLKKFAKEYAPMICPLISPSDAACKNNALCQLQPFKCAYSWLNQNYEERNN